MADDDVITLKTKCPICGERGRHRYRPFCSARCKDLDLGKWFTGAYTVPVVDLPEEADSLPEMMPDEGEGRF